MNCHAFLNILDLYREGRLTPRREKSAAAHLSACPTCLALVVPSQWPRMQAPDNLKLRLKSALVKAPSQFITSPVHLPLWPREAYGVAVAALALLILAFAVGWSGAPSQAYSDDVTLTGEPR
jgi:hypothetical protein